VISIIGLHLHDEREEHETDADELGRWGVSPVENAVQLKLPMTGSMEHADVAGAHVVLI
jgi:hypothetical protein